MKILRSIEMAFSVYSRIPMPHFSLKEDDGKYMMACFPLIGAVTGGILYLWYIISGATGINNICYILLGCAIPVLVTGGIHIDGFMDTMDAFSSFGTKEKKLAILKDPHIGSFAVISLLAYGLIYAAAFSVIKSRDLTGIVCCGFFLSRVMSGLGVMLLPAAKNEGMSFTVKESADRNRVTAILAIEGLICIIVMAVISLYGLLAAAFSVLSFIFYYRKTMKELGGVTGDTAGFFLLVCELSIMIAAALAECIR